MLFGGGNQLWSGGRLAGYSRDGARLVGYGNRGDRLVGDSNHGDRLVGYSNHGDRRNHGVCVYVFLKVYYDVLKRPLSYKTAKGLT